MQTVYEGHFDGAHIVIDGEAALRKGQRVIVTVPEEETQFADDAEAAAVSERLLAQNHEAYEVLAK